MAADATAGELEKEEGLEGVSPKAKAIHASQGSAIVQPFPPHAADMRVGGKGSTGHHWPQPEKALG